MMIIIIKMSIHERVAIVVVVVVIVVDGVSRGNGIQMNNEYNTAPYNTNE